jgi:hypothetical protein
MRLLLSGIQIYYFLSVCPAQLRPAFPCCHFANSLIDIIERKSLFIRLVRPPRAAGRPFPAGRYTSRRAERDRLRRVHGDGDCGGTLRLNNPSAGLSTLDASEWK